MSDPISADNAAFERSSADPGFDPTLLEGFVTDHIGRWSQIAPDKPAIVSRGVSISYRELHSKTNQIARVLQGAGIGPGQRASFVLTRGPRTVLLLISILKTGATYVPIDASSPLTRINDCIEDAAPGVLIVENRESFADLTAQCPIMTLAELFSAAEQASDADLPSSLLKSENYAYVIFTSGSTGRPKGVPISQAALTNFVAGNQIACIRVDHHDVVFQGFSPASDGHHEEIWPTLAAGGTLAVATAKEVYSGLDLGSFLNDFRVTIVSCAPTLLSMVEEDVPSIKRILFGAENLPAALVNRWWTPSREILNTYGPTEATVGATFSFSRPGEAITIGKPLPNYYCYVLDEQLNRVPQGAEGELCISGVGLSPGYMGRDDLTAEKFLNNPHAVPGTYTDKLYRTGDRAKVDGAGNIVWLGRIDGQVKIRGHRIELSEIESCLASCPGVQSGVATVRDTEAGDKMLAALVVARDPAEFDISAVLVHMRDTLPAHMIPAVFEHVDRIPRLPSGKVDRAACQLLRGAVFRIEREIVPPQTENEKFVVEAWKELFGTDEVSATDDFFRDLGGYSLLASRFISKVRNHRAFTRVSVLDLYENPSLRAFASMLDSQVASEHKIPEFKPVSRATYVAARIWQGLGILVLFAIQGLFWLGPILAAIYLSTDIGHRDLVALILGLVLHAISVPLLIGVVIALKWIVAGRFKPGSYPLWGSVYCRWWFVTRLIGIAPVTHITGTPFAAMYMRCLGAKVGKNVFIESLEFDCADLIEIGDDVNLENSAWIHAAEVAYGQLHLRKVKIGDGCCIGVRAGLSGGAVMERGSSLRDLTCVRSGITVPAGEEWQGSIARKADERLLPEYDPKKQPGRGKLIAYGAIQAVLIVVLAMLESLPFISIAFTLYNSSKVLLAYLWEPVYALALVGLAAVQVLVVKWTVLARLKPGTYEYPGFLWLRKWFTEKHLELCSGILVPLYDSLFTRPWCIALGMKCGPRCEIALPRRMPYDLVEMGAESFLASEVSIGRPIRRNGQLFLEHTTVGTRTFLGNDSVVPQGCHVPDEFLLGVLSVCPTDEQLRNASDHHDQAWLGSPAFRMPNRQVMDSFDPTQTYKPTTSLYLQRLAHEAARVVLPGLCQLIVASILVEGFVKIWTDYSLGLAIINIPFLYLLGALIGAGICWLSKKLFIGTYRPTIQPLWSQFVWKTETHSAILHDFGAPLFITTIIGTPYISAFMRMLGCTVGERAFINSTDWTESDLISVGDDAAINANAPLQAHLFEDRVMKVGPIKVGDRCSVGNYSVILCESELKNDAHVGHLSLVMKGETIPSHTFWAGSPAQACDDVDLTAEVELQTA
jgi:non-ribosomal peptide synthetase-like protein